MKVLIAGIGMGGAGSCTGRVAAKLLECDLLVGARRMIESVEPVFSHAHRELPNAVEAVSPAKISRLLTGNTEAERVAVLCSGDTGFFSLASSIGAVFEKMDPVPLVEIEPGISTVQYLSAKLQRPWQGCKLASAHGRDCDVLGLVLQNEELFLLTGGDQSPKSIIEMLVQRGLGFVDVVVASKLSYDDESIACGSAEELAGQEFDPLSSVWISHRPFADESVAEVVGRAGIPDELFVRGDAPMTKSELRALVTSKMRPKSGEVVWDIGAGTGSVGVELACTCPFAQVWALEMRQEAYELIEENRRRFGAYNLKTVLGRAPDDLKALPVPDSVFIGGSTGSLQQIVEHVLKVNPQARIVATAVTLETVAQASDLFTHLEKQGRVEGFAATQMGVTRTRAAGRYHLLSPESPVYIFEACGPRPGGCASVAEKSQDDRRRGAKAAQQRGASAKTGDHAGAPAKPASIRGAYAGGLRP